MTRIRAYPMLVLLLPLVVAILVCERAGWLYPPETVAYDSLYVHTFVLTSDAKPTAKCERFEAQTYSGKVYLYVRRDSTRTMPQQGDTLIAETRIRRADSIGDFDYRRYLLRQGIAGTAYVRDWQAYPQSLPKGKEAKIPLQKRLYSRLSAAGLSGDELATTGALTLGYKEDLDKELKRRFQASGAAHVLAVSGLHTGIIYALLLGLLTLGGRRKPLYENRLGRCTLSLIIIAAMWFYAWLTGMTPSVVRAVLMVTIFEVGRMFYRQTLSLNTIAAAAVFILLVRPLDLWSVSFQLSFAATAAIVLMARELEKLFSRGISRKYRLLNWVVGILIVSVAAQLGTLPLTMHYFGQISNYFLLTNLIVLPLASILVPCGLITIALGGTSLGIIAGKITYGLAWLMNHSVAWLEALPGSTTQVSIGTTMVSIYYAMWIAFILFYANICTRQKKTVNLQPKC